MPTVLITVDALRADHLGQYGYYRDTMPVLDQLTETGTRFENVFSNAPYTRISVPSIHTSRYLAYDEIATLPTIGSILSDHGVRTAGIGTQTGVDMIDGGFKLDENVDLGRDAFHREANTPSQYYLHRLAKAVEDATRWSDTLYTSLKSVYKRLESTLGEGFTFLGYQSAEVVSERVVEHLRTQPDGDFFLWIHYMEAHRPYGVHHDDLEYVDDPPDETELKRLLKRSSTAPERIDTDEHRRLIDLYDSDLRYCSRHLETVFDELRSQGYWTDANVLFTSDHGTEFAEHGRYWHTNVGYDELLHVPLLVKTPGETPSRITEQRELLDIAPTICDVQGIDPSGFEFQGQSVFEAGERRVIALGAADPAFDRPLAARWGGWKYIHEGTNTELYDLEADPDEQRSVADENPEMAERMRDLIPDFLFERTEETLRDPTDLVDQRQLEALGYLDPE